MVSGKTAVITGWDRRSSPRRRILKQGKAVFNGSCSVIDCTIRDISAGGARISCPYTSGLPDMFQLIFMSDRELRDVRVAWRRHNEAGLQFLTGPRRAFHLQL